MEISDEEIRLVQKCWYTLASYAQPITESFYTELFNRFPQYKIYFISGQKQQGEKLMQMLNILTNALNVWDNIEPELIKLGRFHADIGDFTQADYENVAETLIDVLCSYHEVDDQELKEHTSAAWKKIFRKVSLTMMKGA